MLTDLKNGVLLQESLKERDEVVGNLGDIRGISSIIVNIAVPCANGIVHKQYIGHLHLAGWRREWAGMKIQ